MSNLIPLFLWGRKTTKAAQGEVVDVIFKTYSLGVTTNRDVWTYNFNLNRLNENMVQTFIETYNTEVDQAGNGR